MEVNGTEHLEIFDRLLACDLQLATRMIEFQSAMMHLEQMNGDGRPIRDRIRRALQTMVTVNGSSQS